jgi:hypothetical protein
MPRKIPIPDQPNPVETFLLIKLLEECSEAMHATCKILEHGFDNSNPDDVNALNNKNHLARELGDVIAAMHVLCEQVRAPFRNSALNHQNIEAFAAKKRDVLRELAAKYITEG